VAKTITAEKRRRNMACDCAGQSYSYDSTVRGQPVYPTGLSAPLSASRSCRARHFWFFCPLILSSYLILPSTFPPQAPFFLIPFAEGPIRCGGFQLSTSHPKTDFQLFRTPSSLAGRPISNFAFFDLVIFWTCETTISLHLQ
jgi:hypothetical protein